MGSQRKSLVLQGPLQSPGRGDRVPPPPMSETGSRPMTGRQAPLREQGPKAQAGQGYLRGPGQNVVARPPVTVLRDDDPELTSPTKSEGSHLKYSTEVCRRQSENV